MSLFKPFLISLLVLTIVSCGSKQKSDNNISADLTNGDMLNIGDHYSISLMRLISWPRAYDGKKIRVIGYLHLEFEGNAIYLHKEDYDNAISKNGIWVDVQIKHPEGSSLNKFSDHYVILEGTFDGNNNGHMGAFSGSIKDITRLEIWPKMVGTNSNAK